MDQYFDLFLWSVLYNRKEMALVFWEQTQVTPFAVNTCSD